LKKKLNAILCIGESELERNENKTLSVLKEQVYGSLKDITDIENIIVAYEPIWAIGTGLTPSLAEISTTHDSIRSNLLEMYGSSASNIPILYGGSVNGLNASEIFSVANVNGALVGGASLSFDTFSPIVKAIENKT
jgi:triosephosphate isomerase